MRRFSVVPLVLVAALGLIIVSGALAIAARPTQLDQRIYLPLGIQGVSREDLARPATVEPGGTPTEVVPTPVTPTDAPVTVTPTVTATVAVTATAMGTPTSTGTAAPTATATRKPGGRVIGRLTYEGQPAYEATGLIGPALWLRSCTGPDCQTVARSGVVDDDGHYVFEGVPPLPEGAYYQVAWQNEDGDETYGDERMLGSWYGPRITVFTGTEDAVGGDIELDDITLVSPTHGTGFQGLPIPYEWRVRPYEEIYRWALWKGCGPLVNRHNTVMLTESLGHTGSYELNRYPPNVAWGNDNMYCWFIRLENASGYGESYYARMMWFIPVLLSPMVSSGGHWPDRGR